MTATRFAEMRQDCLAACAGNPEIRGALARQHIAVTGGTGFLGTWVAEMVAALNDEYHLGITLDLYARNIVEWPQKYPHLAGRLDVRLRSQDVRSSFEFAKGTSYIVHAAGIPNNRVHSSDPLRVHQTTVNGIANALEAACQLDGLLRFVNVSSCLVAGTPDRAGPLQETDYFPIPSGQLHTVYADAKRSAEQVAAIYRSQYRLPVTTVRPFTLTGAYQELDRPWAINNFLRDALTGSDIRIHGDGSARRSYLYGSDAAWWTLAALVKGGDGDIFNLGSAHPVSHNELVRLIGEHVSPKPRVQLNTLNKAPQQDDLFPEMSHSLRRLGVRETCALEAAIDRTYRWFVDPRN
ncbi:MULTISPECIES: NAD(P)-dependent oxidoreductase [unclassified Duganella]|uniref:NAD-dependent epimerase/dehydratase family protein n=1 Tax=unclassified Duganella TaxID=2636909 RepID=UPI0006FCA654|nr:MULTISPECIES: NAD(P)-dependent oxidoreductase [unclassified Duganella]KQV47550.1 dTDP-glucose 4,6-dehydratase [Duganella sp. Root336D2]KRC00037.1 dTDP-glucose 4,6-dehydratase [Duganella sp. Root198D2]